MTPEAPAGLYVHIPFCLRRCGYCDFATYALTERDPTGYVDAVLREAELRQREATAALDSLYLGGGTPTALPRGETERLLRGLRAAFRLAPEAEVTVEANPGTLDAALCASLREAGANRLSLGVQSFADRHLATLGRAHDGAEAVVAARLASRFPRWSLDLIHAIPGQSVADARADVDRALELGARHVSAYGLTYEEGTPLWRARREGSVVPATEDEELALYRAVGEALEAGGLRRYEVSNFAVPGQESRHNRSYWRGGRYIGLGAAAHSHVGARRVWNTPDPAEYAAILRTGELPVAGSEVLTARDRFLERLMLGLRACEGLPRDALLALAAEAGESGFAARLETSLGRGNVMLDGGWLRIPPERLPLADRIIRDLA